jgi:Malectin domain/Cellulase (glycosyl hydrolase family 5)
MSFSRYALGCLLLVCTLAGPAFAARGRVKVVGTKLVTDQGTVLRGVAVPLPVGSDWQIPSVAGMIRLRDEFGLNSIHIYDRPTEHYDLIVQRTAEAGMYLIITGTRGEFFDGNQPPWSQIENFWEDVAPRYKDATHVIYELQNEPTHFCGLYGNSEIELQKRGYNLIRSLAPNTHVILLTPGQVCTKEYMLNMARGTGLVPSRDNVSAGIHMGPLFDRNNPAFEKFKPNRWLDAVRDVVGGLYADGWPVIETEQNACADPNFEVPFDCLASMGEDYHYQALKIGEELGFGWQSFQFTFGMNDKFKNKCQLYGIKWKPDSPSARWPDSPVTTLPQNPTSTPGPQATAIPTPSLAPTQGPPPQQTSPPTPVNRIRIDAGSSIAYTDSRGRVWQPDQFFDGGAVVDRGAIELDNTSTDALYRTERYSLNGYNIPLANGVYTVKLHFAETYPEVKQNEERLFDEEDEGHP